MTASGTGAMQLSPAMATLILNAAPVGMALIDSGHRFLWANGAMGHLVGRDVADLIGNRLDEVTRVDDLQVELDLARSVAEGQAKDYHLEQRWIDPQGSTQWVSITGSLAIDPDGNPMVDELEGKPVLVRQVTDVTDRRAVETLAARAAEELHDRNEDLERSNEELSQFAYVVSHDLSEPLRVVSGHVALLQDRYHDHIDERADTWINFAVDGCVRMRVLIDDLLHYSRAGRTEPPDLDVDLAQLVAQALHDLGPAIADAGATVEVGALPTVRGDRTQLGQVLANLIANALKFRRPEVPPKIVVSAVRAVGRWQITVSDNGPGIPDRHRQRVFRLFQRLVGRDEVEGTGLGLAICRKIVLRHGGEIWVEEGPDGGAAFCFTLPDRPSTDPTLVTEAGGVARLDHNQKVDT